VPTLSGIFVLGELSGPVAERIHDISRQYDPKMARRIRKPHVTLAGSSGVGPIAPTTSVEELRRRLEPIAQTTAPIELTFQPPHRFLQTDIIVLPFDPHGSLRTLHDRIATSGLFFQKPRFNFSPHVTMTLYRTLTRDAVRELMAVRITEPVVLNSLQLYLTGEPNLPKLLLELPLSGEPGTV
jgi:2'-5' RNA ligase